MEASAQPIPGMPYQNVHKNRLQEYTQRAAIPLPVYQTLNEGSQHHPQFRSTVVVDGATFTSPCTFTKLREAEQCIAKFALEGICAKIKQEGIPLIHNDTAFCKSILHEYAAKMKIEKPTYTTSGAPGLLPTFITSVVFDGKTYTGDACRNKKEAEQIGARTVIDWILGQSDTRTVMAEVIKSKRKLFDTIHKGNGSVLLQDNSVPSKVSLGNTVPDDNTISKGQDVQAVSINDKLPVPVAEHSIPPRAENPIERNICEVCWGQIGRSRNSPTLPHNNQLEGSTSRPSDPDSCHAQIIQVKREVPSDYPHMLPCDSEKIPLLPSDSENQNPNSGGKRRVKTKKRGSTTKKIRRNE